MPREPFAIANDAIDLWVHAVTAYAGRPDVPGWSVHLEGVTAMLFDATPYVPLILALEHRP